ncbi:MAG: amidase [Saprospiraceae bacterium]|nr:MAG: amidase [Saprospiraceae bacterium]
MKNKYTILGVVILSFILGAFTTAGILQNITRADVQAAGKIIGLEFTTTEIDSLIPGLEEFQQDYASNRERSIPNATAPVLVFNPIPIGFDIDQTNRPSGYTNADQLIMPENKEDLAFFTVRQLAHLIKSQQISSEELTKFYLARLKKQDPSLKCVISLTEELALEQAKKADQEIKSGKYRGVLHGIPYGAKDLLATKKYKTTWGATPFKEQSFDYDATVIQKLEEAGAVLVAKLTMGALAWGDVWYDGMTRNPWDPTTGSSGSSAGSASAVSAGLVPFAIGTETLGSIISPSTVCGTTGLRPTFGRVSRYGAMALSWSMDKIGPICRQAEDCALILSAINGKDVKDPSTIEVPFGYNATQKNNRGKIGYIRKDFEKDYAFKEQDKATLDMLKSIGYELVPIELPAMPNIGFILDAEAAAAFDELTRNGQDDQLKRQIRNAWPNVFRQARFIPAVEYIQANRLRSQLINEVQQIFEEVEVIVHPSLASSALSIFNMTGQPSICLPNGFKDQKPTSITFTGQLFREDLIIAVAHAYQERTPFDDQHPVVK